MSVTGDVSAWVSIVSSFYLTFIHIKVTSTIKNLIDNSDIESNNALILNMEYLTKLSVFLCKVDNYKSMKTSNEILGLNEHIINMELSEEAAKG